MKIAILEKTNFNQEQIEKLKTIGDVDFYDSLSQEDANRLAIQYDVVVVNWLDPTPFIMDMRRGSLVALLSTGYGWITNIKEAHEKRIFVCNIPGYSTEAVAEHLLGMVLGISKNIFSTLNVSNNGIIGFELKNKVVGIIGLGNIGSRFAEIMNYFGTKVITYNRTNKNSTLAEDVSLNILLQQSDIICVSCSLNDASKDMINMDNIKMIKRGAVVVGSTWDVFNVDAMKFALKEKIIGSIAFDAAIEAGSFVEDELKNYSNRVYLTPHIAYNTVESEIRQLDICVENICSFVKGEPKNIVF